MVALHQRFYPRRGHSGAALFVSPKTVETHLHRIYVKLRIHSRTELAHLLALEHMLD